MKAGEDTSTIFFRLLLSLSSPSSHTLTTFALARSTSSCTRPAQHGGLPPFRKGREWALPPICSCHLARIEHVACAALDKVEALWFFAHIQRYPVHFQVVDADGASKLHQLVVTPAQKYGEAPQCSQLRVYVLPVHLREVILGERCHVVVVADSQQHTVFIYAHGSVTPRRSRYRQQLLCQQLDFRHRPDSRKPLLHRIALALIFWVLHCHYLLQLLVIRAVVV
mmetsp:Transcript_33876/g.86954  ORF Transcript_33876/g.86954 Transcript_33876/m.86954 type:complete len:224 (-) Transcript_33876:1424-2095(-)